MVLISRKVGLLLIVVVGIRSLTVGMNLYILLASGLRDSTELRQEDLKIRSNAQTTSSGIITTDFNVSLDCDRPNVELSSGSSQSISPR